MTESGDLRFRADWRGRLILQVCHREPWFLGQHIQGHVSKWRDAKVTDLKFNVPIVSKP